MNGMSKESLINYSTALNEAIAEELAVEDEKKEVNPDIRLFSNEIVDSGREGLNSDDEDLKKAFDELFDACSGIIRYSNTVSHYRSSLSKNKTDREKENDAMMFVSSRRILRSYYQRALSATEKVINLGFIK